MNAILKVLDQCVENGTFPMLDNGYVYLAATRLALFRSSVAGPLADWAIVIEVFGFSPRAQHPDTFIQTFASRLHNRDSEASYVSADAYHNYLANNPNNETRIVFPVDFESAQQTENSEMIALGVGVVQIRGKPIAVPPAPALERCGIKLERPPSIQVFELCRYFAETTRDQVLATPDEQRISILPDMRRILQLEEWRHPNLLSGERPSQLQTFQQLAQVLTTGDVSLYQRSKPPNTHWKNWPEGGTL